MAPGLPATGRGAGSRLLVKTRSDRHGLLTAAILMGLLVGAAVGEAVFRFSDGPTRAGLLQAFLFVGSTVFIGLLKMTLVPLVASSVIVGVASIGEPGQLGRIGGWTVVYYFTTMVAAVVLGVILVTSIRPGRGVDAAFRNARASAFAESGGAVEENVGRAAGTGLWGAFRNITEQLIPGNPIGAAARGQILPVISFSLMLGVVLTTVGPRGAPVLAFFEGIFAAVMQLVSWILWAAPLGVACLMAWTVGSIGTANLVGPLTLYVGTVLAGLVIHALIVLPLLLYWLARTNPFRFMYQMREALMTAFATASSSATLPATMESAVDRGGVSRRAAGFVLPLGATVNMDGTALYEAVAAVFLFQCYGIPLGATELLIVVVTATLAAVGAAGIPNAGLITMVIVVEAVNNSLGLSGAARLPLAAVGIIIGIDRILDMCRTAVNVWGDSVGARLITRIAPDG